MCRARDDMCTINRASARGRAIYTYDIYVHAAYVDIIIICMLRARSRRMLHA